MPGGLANWPLITAQYNPYIAIETTNSLSSRTVCSQQATFNCDSGVIGTILAAVAGKQTVVDKIEHKEPLTLRTWAEKN